MKIERFEDIEVWKEARGLVKDVYNCFRGSKDFDLRSQIQRASLSIMNNIAEGFDRGSNKEFIQFLIIARGSVSEVKSILYSALDLGYIGRSTFDEILQKCVKITSLLNGFIRYLNNSERER